MSIDHGLNELIEQVDHMVDTVVSDATLPDPTLRQVLRFLSQVIQVVEQSFHDALSLLIEIKLLDSADLHSAKMRELQKQVELLTARSYYRDAAEVCSRLKHLRENFDEFVRPSVQHLPEFSDWSGVLGLIEHREGRIIFLIEATAREISDLLSQADENTLTKVRRTASQRVDQLRSLLGELRNLNGRILGFSGKAGFLELTRDRKELKREVKIMIDKRDQSVTQGHRISLGSGTTISGTFIVATEIHDSFNQVQQSAADQKIKEKLELLCRQIEEMAKPLPEDKQKEVSQDLSSFVAEATKEAPRRKWYELSAEGLIEAAKACAGIASPVIATVKDVLALLARA